MFKQIELEKLSNHNVNLVDCKLQSSRNVSLKIRKVRQLCKQTETFETVLSEKFFRGFLGKNTRDFDI